MTDLYLGGPIDSTTGDRIEGARIEYDASDLTTHGVIVGMTGSGKTGLGVIFLEEALRSGLPALVIDPKGDMTNLLLTFPELRPSDFRPWIDEAAANKDGRTPDEAAEATAELWRNGLAGWDLSGDDIGALRAQAGFAIYTPGSTAGIPLNVVGSLEPPPLDWDDDAETLRDEIQGFTSGLLGLIDVEADPISSREHILIANLIEYAWRNDQAIDMATLLGWIQRPPIRKLGVFEIDTFYPESDRIQLAMQLNGLMASPSFASWMEGAPLDIPSMLWDDEGRPQGAILYIAHLSDEERQFVVTLVLSKLITWMRSQPGSGELRMLTYMDEVFGFVPPDRDPARQEADPHAAQAGEGLRCRDAAVDPEPRRPRLQGHVERRHLVCRPPPDRARQGPDRRSAELGPGRHRCRRARHPHLRIREATIPPAQHPGEGAPACSPPAGPCPICAAL